MRIFVLLLQETAACWWQRGGFSCEKRSNAVNVLPFNQKQWAKKRSLNVTNEWSKKCIVRHIKSNRLIGALPKTLWQPVCLWELSCEHKRPGLRAACSAPASGQRHSPTWGHNRNDDEAHTNGGGFIVGRPFTLWDRGGPECSSVFSHPWRPAPCSAHSKGRSSQGRRQVPGPRLPSPTPAPAWESGLITPREADCEVQRLNESQKENKKTAEIPLTIFLLQWKKL